VQPVIDPRAIAILDRIVPARGAIHAVYVSGYGFGEVLLGWDAGTGAWYHTTQERYVGCTPDGRMYGGAAAYGSVEWSDIPPTGRDGLLDEFLPLVALADLRVRPEMIERAGVRSDGGVELSYRGPGGGREPRTSLRLPAGVAYPDREVVLVVDPGGCVRSRQVNGEPARVTRLEYDAEPASPWCLAKHYHGFVLASFEFDADGAATRFEPGVVESMAVGAAARVAAGSAFVDSSGVPAAPAPDRGGDGSWGNVVAVSGGLLVLVALAIRALRGRGAK
jgi:hypothetical protein